MLIELKKLLKRLKMCKSEVCMIKIDRKLLYSLESAIEILEEKRGKNYEE